MSITDDAAAAAVPWNGRARALIRMRIFFFVLICTAIPAAQAAFAPAVRVHVAPSIHQHQCMTPSSLRTSNSKRRRISSSSTTCSSALYERKDWTTSLFPIVAIPTTTTPSTSTSTTLPRVIKEQVILPADKGFVSQACCQFYAGSIGALTGFFIAGFKLSIEGIREYAYGESLMAEHDLSLFGVFPIIVLIPVLGGAAVAFLASLGENQSFPPGVKGVVGLVDQDSLGRNEKSRRAELVDSARKAAAATCTLGSGCSLGPEGPGVEIGIVASRLAALFWPQQLDKTSSDNDEDDNMLDNARIIRRNRLFLACGAAAGVSSGFNAPLAGVFFALEVIQKNLPPIDLPVPATAEKSSKRDTSATTIYEFQQDSLSTEAGTITPILTSSVVSALVIRILLGNELALRILEYEIPTPLRELPLYLLLGATSGLVAVVFSQTTKMAKAGFDGEMGPQPFRDAVDATPELAKPAIGGLTCGIVGYFFPQILFFGYETLNGLLLNNKIETGAALSLLSAKIFATAVCAGSGLVGGAFAPSLFMGGMVGVSFHNILVQNLDVSLLDFTTSGFGSVFQIADLPAYTMVGAASFLAAVFRAPLTASLLAFELTKNYDVLVPLLASAGVGTLLCDLVESRIDQNSNSR